jgi:hypothetical protein
MVLIASLDVISAFHPAEPLKCARILLAGLLGSFSANGTTLTAEAGVHA